MNWQMDSLGGNCPVQAEGTIDTVAGDGSVYTWYFRARGRGWSFTVHGSDIYSDRFAAHGWWGEDDYVAGWMSEGSARNLIEMCMKLYELQEIQTAADTKERAIKKLEEKDD